MMLATVPGQRDMRVDARIVKDVEAIIRAFPVRISSAYATSGHAPDGEHPLGLALDIVPDPARGGTWDDVDALVRWAEPKQNQPRSPFRWVGYDGDAGHGKGDHAHLSWAHPDGTPQTITAGVRSSGGGPLSLATISALPAAAAKSVLGIGDVIGNVISGTGQPATPASSAADVGATATDRVQMLGDAFGELVTNPQRAALTLGLVIVAIGLAWWGVARAVGVNPASPIPGIGQAAAAKEALS